MPTLIGCHTTTISPQHQHTDSNSSTLVHKHPSITCLACTTCVTAPQRCITRSMTSVIRPDTDNTPKTDKNPVVDFNDRTDDTAHISWHNTEIINSYFTETALILDNALNNFRYAVDQHSSHNQHNQHVSATTAPPHQQDDSIHLNLQADQVPAPQRQITQLMTAAAQRCMHPCY